jgi:hypothetical protein
MPDKLPRGIAGNNPGNLRPGTTPWLGEIAPDGGYCRFIDPEHGIRALCKTLLAYQVKHDLTTIRGIITRWAPSADNNDTEAYIRTVADAAGLPADATLDLNDASVLSSLALAIIQHENGVQPYSALVLERAASQAVGDGLAW